MIARPGASNRTLAAAYRDTARAQDHPDVEAPVAAAGGGVDPAEPGDDERDPDRPFAGSDSAGRLPQIAHPDGLVRPRIELPDLVNCGDPNPLDSSADGKAPRLFVQNDGCLDLAGRRVEPEDRLVGGVRYPHRALADRDGPRILTHCVRLGGDLVRRWVDTKERARDCARSVCRAENRWLPPAAGLLPVCNAAGATHRHESPQQEERRRPASKIHPDLVNGKLANRVAPVGSSSVAPVGSSFTP